MRNRLGRGLELVLGLGLLLFLSSSCTSMRQPAEEWVRADRATFQIVAPTLLTYLRADVALAPAELRALEGLLGDWEFRVRQGEDAYGITSPAPLLPPPTIPPPPGGGGDGSTDPSAGGAP